MFKMLFEVLSIQWIWCHRYWWATPIQKRLQTSL